MSDLEKHLAENAAPLPRADLSARILAASQSAAPANDASRRPVWMTGIAVAAMALAGVIFVAPNWVMPTADTVEQMAEETEWAQMAETSGFADVYAWVEGVDPAATTEDMPS